MEMCLFWVVVRQRVTTAGKVQGPLSGWCSGQHARLHLCSTSLTFTGYTDPKNEHPQRIYQSDWADGPHGILSGRRSGGIGLVELPLNPVPYPVTVETSGALAHSGAGYFIDYQMH
jgi:hypothetical protein